MCLRPPPQTRLNRGLDVKKTYQKSVPSARAMLLLTLSPVQTDATLLANNSQYCWMLHVTSVCTPCCMLMSVVGSCYEKCEAGQTFSHVQTNATNPNIVGPTLERLSIAFTANGKREFVPRDQGCLLFIDYTKIARFTPILSRIIVLSCFYLLISHCENFLTWISRLPFAVNAMLNLSNVGNCCFRLHVVLGTTTLVVKTPLKTEWTHTVSNSFLLSIEV